MSTLEHWSSLCFCSWNSYWLVPQTSFVVSLSSVCTLKQLRLWQKSFPLSGGLGKRGTCAELIFWNSEPLHIQFGSKHSGLLVKEEGELSVYQEVVVDCGQASAQLQLGSLVTKVYGCSQCQVVVACSIKGVLGKTKITNKGVMYSWSDCIHMNKCCSIYLN